MCKFHILITGKQAMQIIGHWNCYENCFSMRRLCSAFFVGLPLGNLQFAKHNRCIIYDLWESTNRAIHLSVHV